jgi:hypothetical protein
MHNLRKALSENPYGMLEEKSSGHPLLDDIRSAFRELLDARETVETYRKLVDCLSGEVEGVQANVTLTVTGGRLDKAGMLAGVMEQNPELAAQLEQDPELRAQAEVEMEQLIDNDQNRIDRSFNINLDIGRDAAAKMLDALVPHLPNPHTLAAGVSSLLKETSLKIYDPDWRPE